MSLEKLLPLVVKLHTESEHFIEHPEETQLWYDRGYANGMLKALTELGYHKQLPTPLNMDTPETIAESRWMPWGHAYQHGFDKGYEETLAVLSG